MIVDLLETKRWCFVLADRAVFNCSSYVNTREKISRRQKSYVLLLFFLREKERLTQTKDFNLEQSNAQQQLELQNAKLPNVVFAVPTARTRVQLHYGLFSCGLSFTLGVDRPTPALLLEWSQAVICSAPVSSLFQRETCSLTPRSIFACTIPLQASAILFMPRTLYLLHRYPC